MTVFYPSNDEADAGDGGVKLIDFSYGIHFERNKIILKKLTYDSIPLPCPGSLCIFFQIMHSVTACRLLWSTK